MVEDFTSPQSPRRCQDRVPAASSKVFHQVQAQAAAPRVLHRGGLQAILEISIKGEDDRWVMRERHDAKESCTIIEQYTAFGNLNIGVSFVVRRKSGVVMPAEVWTRSQSGEESILLGTVSAAFGERRRIITAYLNKPNLAWLQLYAYIATALKALIDGHDNPDNANAGISKGVPTPALCDVATSSKSYVILDWPLRQKTGKHIRTFQSHMHDNAWDNVIEMSYYASDDMRTGTTTPLVARLRGLINTLKGGGRWKPSVTN